MSFCEEVRNKSNDFLSSDNHCLIFKGDELINSYIFQALYNNLEKNSKCIFISMKDNKSEALKDLDNFYYECKKNLNLDIIGLMCLPPQNENPEKFFQKLKECSDKFGLTDLSMGMSNDYDVACKFGSTFLRIGTKIFGERG